MRRAPSPACRRWSAPGAIARAACCCRSSGYFPVDRAALQRPDLLAGRRPRTINMMHHRRRLLRDSVAAVRPAIEALIVYNSNPVAVAPDSGKVVAGFAREDLFTVVLEQFQTDTADYADYVLPATTQLEHWDIHLHLRPHRRAAEPAGDRAAWARRSSNTEVFRELARAHGLRRAVLRGRRRGAVPRGLRRARSTSTSCWTQGFATLPIARCALRATAAFPRPRAAASSSASGSRAQGQDGLPDHVPNYEAAGSSTRYPLAMISPPARNFLNSTFVNVRSLRAIEGEPLLEIHADDAAARGIADGAVVRVFNDRGEYRCSAEVSRARAARRGARPGHLVAQARPGRHQRQPAHQPAADRHRARARRSTTAWSKSQAA